MKLTILAENHAEPPYEAEHGLAMLLEWRNSKLLFDTGAGSVLPGNLRKMNRNLDDLAGVILSHGHRDHTGGLFHLPPQTIWHAPGIDKIRYSLHPDKPVRELTMPEPCRELMRKCRCIATDSFTEILPGLFLTGPIPRSSGEDCGGPFYCDPNGTEQDWISDEQAVLTENGILIQGCCHAGVINTLNHCRKCMPEIKIHTIIGGLHLLAASDERLKQTADSLRKYDIKTLYLMHCTGENAIHFLKKELPHLQIFTPCTDGKTIIPDEPSRNF